MRTLMSSGNSPSDVDGDGDGAVGIDDLIAVLAGWSI